MNGKQQDPASSDARSLLLSHEEESAFAEELKLLLSSTEARGLIRDLMSDDRSLAQIGGLMMSEAENEEISRREAPWHHQGPSTIGSPCSHPVPSHRGFNYEVPTAGQQPRHKPRSPMEAQAPFTPTVPAGVMGRGASAVFPPTVSLQQTAPGQLQHHVEGVMNHPCPISTVQTARWPCQYHPPPPAKNSSRGNARRPKTTFSMEQLELLEMTFDSNHYPSSVLRKQLSYVSGHPLKIIKTWFQNRRVRFRRREKITYRQTKQCSASERSSREPSPTKSPSVSGSQASNETSSPSGQSASAHPSDEFQQVFPPSEGELGQPAGQPRKPEHCQNSWDLPPSPQGVDGVNGNQSQLRDQPLQDQAPSSTELYRPMQQHMDSLPSRWDAVSPWPVLGSRGPELPDVARPSGQFNSPQGVPSMFQSDYQYFPLKYPGAARPTIHNWGTIYPNPSQHSNQQHQVAPSPIISHHMPQMEAVMSQYQPPAGLPGIGSYNPAVSSGMPQNRSSHHYNFLGLQSTTHYSMHPQHSSDPPDTQGFATPDPFLRCGFPGAYPRQALPSDNQGYQDDQNNAFPSSVPQHGFINSYPTPALPSHDAPRSPSHLQASWPRIPVPHSSFSSQSGFSNQYPDIPTDGPRSRPDGGSQIFPAADSVAQDENPPMQSGHLLCRATPSFNPGSVALLSDSQPNGLVPACNQPLMPPAGRPSALPSSPASACSLGSCHTLYIDLDAETD